MKYYTMAEMDILFLENDGVITGTTGDTTTEEISEEIIEEVEEIIEEAGPEVVEGGNP